MEQQGGWKERSPCQTSYIPAGFSLGQTKEGHKEKEISGLHRVTTLQKFQLIQASEI